MLNSSRTKEEARITFFTSFRLNKIKILDELLNSYLIMNISAYRLAYINIKDVIIFVVIRIKNLYNRRY